MTDVYAFDAHVCVMAGSDSKQEAADKILEHCLDADIAISLHEPSVQTRRDDDEDNWICPKCHRPNPPTNKSCGWLHDDLVEQGQCEHGKGLTDYCQPCGRIHGG